jgi:hypothetical protein
MATLPVKSVDLGGRRGLDKNWDLRKTLVKPDLGAGISLDLTDIAKWHGQIKFTLKEVY